MTPRTTLFLSTRGQPPGFSAFTVANDDMPDRPASAGFALRAVATRSHAASNPGYGA